jgi:diguanylate cyclase (GGDEF)-like protein/PAS domain S-box-containing protein
MIVSAPDLAVEYEALIQFLYLAPVGLAQIGSDGEILMINPISAQLLMPLTRDATLSNLFVLFEPVLPDLRQTVAAFTKPYGMVCDGLRIQVSAGVRGESDPQILSLTLLKLDEARLMVVLADISQQVRRERLMRQNDVWLSAILTDISDYALISLDRTGHVTDWNAGIGRVTGFDAAAVVGQPFSVFYPADTITVERIEDRLREADDNGWSLDDGWRLRADGSRFWGSGLVAVLPDCNDKRGTTYCLIIRDISDQREVGERQRRETSCDFLTGIANRRAFFEAAEVEIRRWQRAPRPLSIIVFDADLFKTVNDNYGHAAGDAVLRDFALVLTSAFRPIDLVARIGGEEFAVLMPSTGPAEALAAAERVRTMVANRPVVVDGHAIAYTVSGGVASMDADLNELDALMKEADLALYRAKHAGRNRVSGAPRSMHDNAHDNAHGNSHTPAAQDGGHASNV